MKEKISHLISNKYDEDEIVTSWDILQGKCPKTANAIRDDVVTMTQKLLNDKFQFAQITHRYTVDVCVWWHAILRLIVFNLQQNRM